MHSLSSPRARRALAVAAIATATTLAVSTAVPAAAGGPRHRDPSRDLRQAVTPAGVGEHLEAFQAIADQHDGNRASGTTGYTASRDYVVKRLRRAGYRPTVQEFDFPFFQERTPASLERTAPVPTTYDNPTQLSVMTYSGSGVAEGKLVPVDTDGTATDSSTSGCEETDFTGFPAGAVALVQRGTCTFGTKALNAERAGASGVIVFNRGTEGATDVVAGTLGAPDVTVPVIGVSFDVGQDLASSPDTAVRVTTDTISEVRKTWNVLAETRAGNPDQVVMAGSHLDSVLAGAGMNDNASGSSTILEVAEAMARTRPVNKVRFAWWGAEELGLLGSEHYVADLAANDPTGLEAIAMYLNFDMIGSPNFVRFVLDGDNSAFPVGPGAAEGPEGSAEIEAMFHDYFASQDLASAEAAFTGRSDYGPFIEQGIASGGLFTGHEGIKTAEQAEEYGGVAGEPFDPCYHGACDDIDNVSMTAIDQMSDAVAHVVITAAMAGGDHAEHKPGKRHGKRSGHLHGPDNEHDAREAR